MALPILPLIALGISAISSIIQKGQENRAIKKTNEANKALAEYSFEQQKQMVADQNRYNSPQAQMSRYADAGLNPHLIYGQGSSGNQTTTPTYHAPEMRPETPITPDIPGAISSFQQVAMQQAQIDQVKAQTRNIDQQTWNNQIKSGILNMNWQTGEFELNRKKNLAPYQLTVAQNEAEASQTRYETAVQSLQNMREDQKLKLLSQKYSQGALTTQQQEQEQKRLQIVFDTFRNQFKEMGVESHDNFWVRFFSRMMQESNINIFEPAKNGFQNLKNAKRPGTYLK